LLLASTGAALPGELTGQSSIIDGDTLEIHSHRIRLWGIDAPRKYAALPGRQQYPVSLRREGRERSHRLHRATAQSCASRSRWIIQRTVAACSVDGVDLGDWLVRGGLALDWPQYSKVNTVSRSATPSMPARDVDGQLC